VFGVVIVVAGTDVVTAVIAVSCHGCSSLSWLLLIPVVATARLLFFPVVAALVVVLFCCTYHAVVVVFCCIYRAVVVS